MIVDFTGRNLYFFLLLLWASSEFFIGKWMFGAKPEKHRIDKYPKMIILLSQLPFGVRWKKNVDKEDIPIFERYQRRIRIMYISTFFPLLIMYIFFNYTKF
jgi:hypothetical protein